MKMKKKKKNNPVLYAQSFPRIKFPFAADVFVVFQAETTFS